jgi:hypothetical protein
MSAERNSLWHEMREKAKGVLHGMESEVSACLCLFPTERLKVFTYEVILACIFHVSWHVQSYYVSPGGTPGVGL